MTINQKNRKGSSLSRMAFVFICVLMIVLIINVNIDINTYKQRAQELELQIEAIDREIERIETEYQKPVTDEMMRQLARDTLGFYMSNEIIYEVS